MSRRLLLPAILATILLLAAAAAGGAGLPALHGKAAGPVSASAPLPTIKRVTPLKLSIGEKLTIVGRHFIPGKRRNTVVFLRDGAPAVFLRAGASTRTRMTVTLTSKLDRYLVVRNNGEKKQTRFRLRVLARRFGPRFTPLKRSPLVLPAETGGGGGTDAPTCTLASAKAAPEADADGDGLTNGREVAIKTDPCLADSDGDRIPDGYEFESALDLNLRALPYPGKRPYPNPLDPSDPGVDYDGDGLTLSDEHAAWVAYGGSRFPLNYSDGTQTTGGPLAVTPGSAYGDINDDGFLTDDEKDVDTDGLTNWDEAHGRMTPGWWIAVYQTEKPFTVTFLQTDWLDRDTDGDTLADGPDDVDHDGYANAEEIERDPYWVQPFNPCLPDPESRTCPKHPPVQDPYPPFGAGGWTPGEPIPLAWPR
jgi:Bacterial TSP3 repeat